MNDQNQRSPEARELDRQKERLASFEATLSQEELALATLEAELSTFERRYLSTVGVHHGQLDAIEAEIAETAARARPGDREAQDGAARLRANANESARAVDDARSPDGTLDVAAAFRPSDEQRQLYREIAKQVHPDLVTDPQQRITRTAVMAEVNRAYKEGDTERLKEILRTWLASPDSVEGEGIGAELIRVIRRIDQITNRLAEIQAATSSLRASDLFVLRSEVEGAAEQGRDLLNEMALSLLSEIEAAKARLEAIRAGAA